MIRYKFFGNVDNSDILRYYQNNKVDCFIHLSESEGLPVAVMEAVGAGIPIIATDAGGTREAIRDNGILLPIDITPQDVADAIGKMMNATPEYRNSMRRESRKIWLERFDAVENASGFVDELKNIGDGIRRIIFVTEGYPYTNNEMTFLQSELMEMLQHFDVTIIAVVDGETTCKSRHEDRYGNRLSVIPYNATWRVTDVFRYMILYLFDKRIRTERSQIWRSQERKLIRYWESIKFYAEAQKFYKWFISCRFIDKSDLSDTLIYTYWNMQQILGFGLNRDKIDSAGIITRTHGYDWQNKRWEKSLRKPFAQTVDNLVDRIVFVSETSEKCYLKQLGISEIKDKHCYRYLGTVDPLGSGEKEDAIREEDDEDETENTYRIASCSALIPLKRVDIMIDALESIQDDRTDINIEWVHFGDGPLRSELEAYAKERLGEQAE